MKRHRVILAAVFTACFLTALLIGPAALAAPGQGKCASNGYTVPAPGALKLVSKTDTSAVLKWSAPRDSRDVKSYNVYRGATLAGTVTGTTFTDTSLIPNTAYTWTVKAVDRYNRLSAGSNKLSAATPIIIRDEVLWTASNVPTAINGGLIVEPSGTLSIDPGVTVRIRAGQSVTVRGSVQAAGEAGAPISFTKAPGACSGYWGTIHVAAGGQFSGDYVKITYGTTLATVKGMLILNNSEIAYAKTQGILVEAGGEFNGTNNKLHDCCEASGCKGIIAKGSVNLSSSQIYNCKGTGVVVESSGNFNGTSLSIRNCGKGVEVKGSANLVLCSVSGCGYGLFFNTAAFNGVILNSFMGNNKYAVYNSRPTTVTIDASTNYWGSPNGPSVYDDATRQWVGDGDRVSKGVNYGNWLTEPAQ